MFLFSMIQDGPRGLEHILTPPEDPEALADPTSYGIDWAVAGDVNLMQHLLVNNPQEQGDDNPFNVGPATLSDVPCEPPDSPITAAQIVLLDSTLAVQVNTTSRSMEVRQVVWQRALQICCDLWYL